MCVCGNSSSSLTTPFLFGVHYLKSSERKWLTYIQFVDKLRLVPPVVTLTLQSFTECQSCLISVRLCVKTPLLIMSNPSPTTNTDGESQTGDPGKWQEPELIKSTESGYSRRSDHEVDRVVSQWGGTPLDGRVGGLSVCLRAREVGKDFCREEDQRPWKCQTFLRLVYRKVRQTRKCVCLCVYWRLYPLRNFPCVRSVDRSRP